MFGLRNAVLPCARGPRREEAVLRHQHTREVQELDASELGEMIRSRRVERKMSLAQVAKQAGVSTSFVGQVERGVATPTLSTLKSLVESLGSSVGALLEEGDWSDGNGGQRTENSDIAV